MEPVMIAVLTILVIVCGLILGKLFTIFAKRQPKAVCQFCHNNLPITLAYDSDINWHTTCVKHATIKIKIDNLERELLDSQEPEKPATFAEITKQRNLDAGQRMAIAMGAPLTPNEKRIIANLDIPKASHNTDELWEAGYDILDGNGNVIHHVPKRLLPFDM